MSENKGETVIDKSTFYKVVSGIVVLIAAVFGLNIFHIGTHHGDTPALIVPVEHPIEKPEVAHDRHIHPQYWINNQEKPGTLIQVKNRVYGEPKPNLKHRHTGADYWQGHSVTWKHVNDQHEKLTQ